MSSAADFDVLDTQLAAALQVNGRASWGLIAKALDTPERTVARRGQRLLDSGLVRVSTYLDTSILGRAQPVIIHIETKPGKAMEVANVLALRADASSVSVLESGAEIVCELVPRTFADSTTLLRDELPAIEGIVSLQVSTVLKLFRSGYDWGAIPLPDRVVEMLRPDFSTKKSKSQQFTDDDDALVKALAVDGRATVVQLAETLGVSTPTVRRRLDALFDVGAMHVRTEIAPALHGLRVEALSWLRVAPNRIEEVGQALARNPSVRFCASCTGASQMLVDCLVEDEAALYRFLTEDVAALGVESSIRMSVVLVPVRRGPMTLA
ncbi:Lrp/AsnC family transcriptional regulator [soil metagenome]